MCKDTQSQLFKTALCFYALGQDGVYILQIYEWKHEKPKGVHDHAEPTSGTC